MKINILGTLIGYLEINNDMNWHTLHNRLEIAGYKDHSVKASNIVNLLIQPLEKLKKEYRQLGSTYYGVINALNLNRAFDEPNYEFDRLKNCLPLAARDSQLFHLLFLRQRDQHETLRYSLAIKTFEFLKAQSILNRINISSTYTDQLFWNQQFPLVVETVMTILYYENQILDRKFGVVNHDKISINLLEVSLLREGLYKYIDTYVNSRYKYEVKLFVSRTIIAVDSGQWLQKEMNSFNAWVGNKIIPINIDSITENHYDYLKNNAIEDVIKEINKVLPDFVRIKKNYIHNYLSRIFLTNSVFFLEILNFNLKYTYLSNSKKETIKRVFATFGLIHQLVNDVADFIPNNFVKIANTKIDGDHLKDVENEIITLPIALNLYLSPNGELDQYFKSPGKPLNKVRVISSFEGSLAPYYLWQITSSLVKSLQQELAQFDTSTIFFKDLREMLEVGLNNKFYSYYLKKSVLLDRYKNLKKKQKKLLVSDQLLSS